MPKDDSSGLLSKVVKFVRNPGAWTEGEGEGGDEGSYSKQMLKEMIERKRRNDFVRKREFDMLRKMRRSEVMAGDPGARPSFFQSSIPSKPDDRASTLKKIDEIEAQMSMQWWKTKHGGPENSRNPVPNIDSEVPDSAVAGPAPAAQRPMPPRMPAAAAPVSPVAYHPTEPAPLGGVVRNPRQYDPTEPAPLGGVPRLEQVYQPPQAPAPAPGPRASAAAPLLEPLEFTTSELKSDSEPLVATAPAPLEAREVDLGGFTPSRLPSSAEVEEFSHDPELEEASIRFANGDDAGAEAGLKEVLGPGGTRTDHDETWLTLFDLYRATGQQDRFETAAIEFAGRFGRSAPQWYSLPDAVAKLSGQPAAGAAPAPTAANAIADWTSPSSVGTQTLAALNAALTRAQPPWRLSWAKLVTIEDAAVEPLARLFAQWATKNVELRFIGTEVLERVLRDATPSGDRATSPAWWKLRMEVLRVMHRPDEFELVALDYCVTYEVSPPSWESARCQFKPLQADGSAVAGNTIIGEAFRDSMASMTSVTPGFTDTQAAPATGPTSMVGVELAGQIVGDGKEAIELLDGKLTGADAMVISCARLIRIDFTAAGSLLNWVSSRQNEGRQVQFMDVHRLVAAFFNVIGINEHARIAVRRD